VVPETIESYEYDLNGNVAEITQGGQVDELAWNEEDQLVSWKRNEAPQESYVYGADGMRRRKVTSAGTQQFVWDGDNVLREVSPSGEVNHYSDYPRDWGGLTSQREVEDESSRFYVFDPSGNARMVLDSSGNVGQSFLSTAFGESVAGVNPTPFGFGGAVGYYDEAL
jgi:YD repeat-containing protein